MRHRGGKQSIFLRVDNIEYVIERRNLLSGKLREQIEPAKASKRFPGKPPSAADANQVLMASV